MVVIRPWRLDDAEALVQAVRESRDHLRPWMPWAAQEPDVEARRAWIAVVNRDPREEIFGVFADRTAGASVIGGCGLHHRIGPGGAEIGYWVHAAHLRRGIATEVVGQLVEWAFARPGVQRVEIRHDAANVASAAVARRAGFTKVGERPRPRQAPAEVGVEWAWRLEKRR